MIFPEKNNQIPQKELGLENVDQREKFSAFALLLFNLLCLADFVIPVICFFLPKQDLILLNISTEKLWIAGPILYIVFLFVAAPVCAIVNAILAAILARNKKFGIITYSLMIFFLVVLGSSTWSFLLGK